MVAIAAISAAIVDVYQASLARMTMGADIIMKLENRFDNDDFIEIREKTVHALKSKCTYPHLLGIDEENTSHHS